MDLSIYFVIGSSPDEFFDSSRIGGYLPISLSLLIKSISRSFYDVKDENIQILGVGQKRDYLILKHTNNKVYYQSGNDKDDFYTINTDQNIKIKLFPEKELLFLFLNRQILSCPTENILLILQDHGSLYQFNRYSHIKLLYLISQLKKNFLIYNDSCNSGSLIDLFEKNKALLSYINKNNLKIGRKQIAILYYFALFQNELFEVFKDKTSTFFPQCIDFISKLSDVLFEDSIYDVFIELFKAWNKQNSDQDFSTPINKDFFDKLKKNSNFDISKCISENANDLFLDLDSFLTFLQKNNIMNLSDLLMFKVYYLFVSEPDKEWLQYAYFLNKENYELFFNIEKVIFDLPNPDGNASYKTIDEQKLLYNQIVNFFNQYYHNHLLFFDCQSNVEFITSTSLDQTSLNYSSIIINYITKVFHITPDFSYFIKYAFFNLKEHKFDFLKFAQNVYGNPNYQKFEKPNGKVRPILIPPQHYIYPDDNNQTFFFKPSTFLPKKIASVRFLTHFIRNYLSRFNKLDYFPKLNFTCGLSRIPSNLLINFISLSILPNSDAFPSDLKLYNENFLIVLKFANLIFQENSMNKQPKQISINNNRFEFTVFFSVVLSSKIRYLFAKNLLEVLKIPSNLYTSLYLFSIKELIYAQEFINSIKMDKCTDASDESAVLFLKELFSVNLIDQYYSFSPPDDEEEKSREFKRLRELKKSPIFNLQKMFMDLESSILNILPGDAFVFSAIYSYLFLKYHNDIEVNPLIQKDIEIILQSFSKLLDKNKFDGIKGKLNTFKNLTDILQFCNKRISKCLQKTIDFLQSFYRSYYIVSFCKVTNQYKKPTDSFNNFLEQIDSKIPSNSFQDFFESLTQKLKPFPLFCLPFIFFDNHSYSSYKSNLMTFFSNFNSNNTKNEFENLPNSFDLLESNYFYSEQFRIHLSNLSLYSDLKIYVIENINLLNKFSENIENIEKTVSNFLSHPFFKNTHTSVNFEFDYQENKNFKNVFEFYNDSILENYMKQSISTFIEEFVSTTTQFLHNDIEETIELDFGSCTYKNDYQLFFCHDEESKIYIDSLLKNLNDLINKFSISKPKLTYNIVINEDMHASLIRLVYSVLEARFNNKVEMEPIVELIPKYVEKFSDQNDWSDPTEQEYMALCSAIQFTLSPTDKFRKIFLEKFSSTLEKTEEEFDDEYYSPFDSPSLVKVGNYRNEFSDEDKVENDNNIALIQDRKYKKIVEEALDLSEAVIYDLRKRYDIRHKKWTEIIWSIFYEFFNKKLAEIKLKFDVNNEYSQGYSCTNCLVNENSIIIYYLPQFENMKDYHDKEKWVGRFIFLHKDYQYQIKSAYVYALISSYSFLNNYYSFDDF